MVRVRYCVVVAATLVVQATSPGSAAAQPVFDSFIARGVRIRYLVQGEGEPVVLIHGLHSSALMNWKLPGIVDRLARDHQVIALDLPGHGGSDKPVSEDAYGERMVEAVVLLLDHVGLQRAHVVGYSLGGMIALNLVARYPERALSAILGGMGWMREGSRVQEMWDKIPVRSGNRTPTACVRSMGQLAVTEDALRAIETPVVVLVGDRDPVKPLYVAPLQEVRKDWPVIEIENAGHLSCITKQRFAEEIAQWLDRN